MPDTHKNDGWLSSFLGFNNIFGDGGISGFIKFLRLCSFIGRGVIAKGERKKLSEEWSTEGDITVDVVALLGQSIGDNALESSVEDE